MSYGSPQPQGYPDQQKQVGGGHSQFAGEQFSGQQIYGQVGSPQPNYSHQVQPPFQQHPSYQQQQPQPHPTMQETKGIQHAQPPAAGGSEQEWNNGFCDCFSDVGGCCLTCWCPCITYGKIQYRLRNNDMSGYSSCNGNCCGFCALMSCCGFQWILSMAQRGEMRHKFGLKGSGCGDCIRHYCCECCALIQEDKESQERKGLIANNTGYQQQGGMQYPGH